MSTRGLAYTGSVGFALWRRSLLELARVRGGLLPTTVAPLIFLLGSLGQFGRLDQLVGFPTTSYIAWLMPLSCLQAAGFAGGATGANLARDIEAGWFDRLLSSPAPRPLLILGPVMAAMTRCLIPVTVILIVGLLIGNLLAVLTWRYLTAPIACSERLTLYYKMEKIAGRGLVTVYNLANGLLFCFLGLRAHQFLPEQAVVKFARIFRVNTL
jgi:hypothetical protein